MPYVITVNIDNNDVVYKVAGYVTAKQKVEWAKRSGYAVSKVYRP